MACAKPLKINNPNFSRKYVPINWNVPYFEVPCGWCLNCRVDKRNALEFECFQEYKKFDGFSAFVTLTYDDYSILHCLRKDKNNNLVASLVHKDIQDFLKRLRRNLDYFLETHPGVESNACSRKFKVLYVGEYGENGSVFDRPHWHLLFFGLDYSLCSKIISSAWRDTWYNSLCDIKPLLNGGIRYVLKYCDKQLFGEAAKQKYDDNNLERPKMRRSRFFAFDYYLENMDKIIANNCCVRWRHNINLPVRSYIRNKLYNHLKLDTDALRKHYQDTLGIGIKHRLSLKELNQVRHSQALLRCQNLIYKSRQNGEPAFDVYPEVEIPDNYFDDLIKEIDTITNLSFLERQYYKQHHFDDVVPF